ncbi:MAG: hypothetical protein KDK74_05560 [Cephaloticoccus sp.]|nr:hypothetical protein [Cephaloticoccus sp.]
MKNLLFLLAIPMLLTGCGPATFSSASYVAVPQSGKFFEKDGIRVMHGIAATRVDHAVLPIYSVDKRGGPYFLELVAFSSVGERRDIIFLGGTIQFASGRSIEIGSLPITVKFRDNDMRTFSEIRTRVPIGDSLVFEKGLEFEMTVKFKISDQEGVHEISNRFIGSEKKETGTTFDVIMGV